MEIDYEKTLNKVAEGNWSDVGWDLEVEENVSYLNELKHVFHSDIGSMIDYSAFNLRQLLNWGEEGFINWTVGDSPDYDSREEEPSVPTYQQALEENVMELARLIAMRDKLLVFKPEETLNEHLEKLAF